MVQNLEEFIRKFTEIRDMGWIKTHRSGNTGVGKTLEDLLGIKENNIQGPDFGTYELKASRNNSNSMLTIITKSPMPKGSNTELRLKYGYSSDAYANDDKVLHSTLNSVNFTSIANTGNFLKICYEDDKIYIESQTQKEDIYWKIDELKRCFENKIKNKLVYVKADSQGSGANEQFHYTDAYLVYGFDSNAFIRLIKEGKIYVDLRIGQYPNGRTHDHGTGFRIRECDQYLLFSNIDKLV